MSEGLITFKKAEQMLGKSLSTEQKPPLSREKAFMRLSLNDRRRIMLEQTQRYSPTYEPDIDWMEMQGDVSDDFGE